MSEFIIPPTPNWFLNGCVCITADGCMLYGALSNAIAILEPNESKLAFKNVKIISPAHKEKVICLAACPNWTETRSFVSGSEDGLVKSWNGHTLTSTIAHNTHTTNKESVIGVAFVDNKQVFSIGSLGIVCLWNLSSNSVQSDRKLLRAYKPTCISVFPHKPDVIAVGTKQGIIVLLSTNDKISIISKVPGHKTEITSIAWCPTIKCEHFDNLHANPESKIKKKDENKANDSIKSLESKRFDKIVNLPPIDSDAGFDFLKECQDLKKKIQSNSDDDRTSPIGEDPARDNRQSSPIGFSETSDVNNGSKFDDDGDSSNDSSIVADESDIFDMYKDNTMEEFGHTRKVVVEDPLPVEIPEIPDKPDDIVHYYLASCCKRWQIQIWKWDGTMAISRIMIKTIDSSFKKTVDHPFGAIHWISPDSILVASKEAKLLKCHLTNPFKISSLHSVHKRGLFKIASNTSEKNQIAWTISMDRMLAAYSFENSTCVTYSTFGGHVYDIQKSPIDPNILAIGGGDGIVRVIRLQSDGGVYRAPNLIKHLWNGIHGKVVSVAWHPTKENCLAFATYEGKIGILNTQTGGFARILPFALTLGAYNICWDSSDSLFACGNSKSVVYNVTKSKNEQLEPETIEVTACGIQWSISRIVWSDRFLSVGSKHGGFALLKPQHPYDLIADTYPFKRTVNFIAWHPAAVEKDEGTSPYVNLVALAAYRSNIIILKLIIEGDFKFETYQEIVPISDVILNLSWSPYVNGQLLYATKDGIVNIWDVDNNCLVHTFTDHQNSSVHSAAWCSPTHVITASADCTVRLWNTDNYPAVELPKIKPKNKKKTSIAKSEEVDSAEIEDAIVPDVDVEADLSLSLAKIQLTKKNTKKILPLSLFWKQYKKSTVEGCRRLFQRIVAQNSGDGDFKIDYGNGFDYLRIYGKFEDVVELVDIEQDNHKETLNWNGLVSVGIIRGDLKGALEYVSQHGGLTSNFLLLAPSVSHRFWKEMVANYCSQLESAELKKSDFDGSLDCFPEIWRGLLLLSSGQLEESCDVFSSAGLEPEAICIARARQADHIAEKQLQSWMKYNVQCGQYMRAAECCLALGSMMDAAIMLGKLNGEDELMLAADIAKFAGNSALADTFSVTA